MLRKNEVMFLILLNFLCSSLLQSQKFVFSPHKFGANLFAGGIDNPRFQFMDIDGDIDQDLFILDRDEQTSFYRNHNGEYKLEQNQTFGLTVGSWFHFVDIDNDGDKDCFTNIIASEVSLYTNVGSSTNSEFQLTTSALKDTSGNELFSESFSIPTFADIDADGDYDFFSGSQSGSITFYKNVGSPSVPNFAFVTNEFDGIRIIGGGISLSKAMHGASGIEFFDADSNGTLDLFWGDYFNTSMYFLKNIGTALIPHFLLSDSTYPKEEIISTFGFNIPQHVDIDNDGFIDLLSGGVFPNEGEDNFWFYRNEGTNAQPLYSLRTKNFIPMVDVGTRSTIAAADFDGDNDFDLCIGNGEGNVFIFTNSGTAHNPIFSITPSLEFSINDFYAAVTSEDINGDAKPDLLIGRFSGNIDYYENISTPNKIEFENKSFTLDGIDVGNSAAPCIIDADGDGKKDILIGTSGGVLWFYKNVGTNSSPSYSLISTKFESIDVGSEAMPTVIDFDKDGNVDLFIGNSRGIISRYEFNPSTQKFDSLTASFDSLDIKINASPSFVDIDGDSDFDLFAGNGKGGLFYFENTTINNVHNKDLEIPSTVSLGQNYPNPFNPSTTIQFHLNEKSFVLLEIFDLLGREIATLLENDLQIGEHSVSWNAEGFPSGIYFYRLTVLSKIHHPVVLTRPMTLLK